MTLLIPAYDYPTRDSLCWMSGEQYVACRRLLDDELTGYYRRASRRPA